MKLLLFLVIILSIFTATKAGTGVVRDTDGKPLKPGKYYYIISGIDGHDTRGLELLIEPKILCPPVVVQADVGRDIGNPITFFPVKPNAETVKLGEDTNIAFADIVVTICMQPPGWRLMNSLNEQDYPSYVSTGANVGKPGSHNSFNEWFKVEEHNMGAYTYKLVFCPDVCHSCNHVPCRDMTIKGVTGLTPNGWDMSQWLVLTNGTEKPFPFRFRKASI